MTLFEKSSEKPGKKLVLNQKTASVTLGSRRIRLTQQEFLLLYALAAAEGQPVARDTLLLNVWQCKEIIKTRTIDVHVQRLRAKLGQNVIETVRGLGYRMTTEQVFAT